MTILVIGLAGTGKTTYCKERLGADGLCYDLDALAAAFRLREPHEEQNEPSRWMANDLLFGFISHAWQYAEHIFIIRTAPTVEEMRDINPDMVVICRKKHTDRPTHDEEGAIRRIELVKNWCNSHGIPVDERE